ncbi:MAG: Stk1 family PASTA domain-containing Ser/Thr kinase [Clostridiales bacterium]|nr:Stk1 family PASTA domain-containing Ser/Thr kinase [Clostridiales bacterium]
MMKGMLFADRYKLEEFIGQGGMSLVYRAVDIRTGHSVAVKILKSEYNSDKEFLERFQREAQAASMMSHHNIVNLLDVGVEGEYRYLVLEYVSGNTLKDIIRQKGRLTWQTSIQVAVRILSALQHAHDNGIIHRDIKPQNVLIHADGHVKVADFGIARMTNAFTISKGDTVVGSVHYSSPEQASGTVVEFPSDLYSTGVVMYEMLTGRVPFVGDTPVAVAMQHLNDMPPPIVDFAPETPASVIAVVMKAMAKNPKDRFQSAREMADALLQAKAGTLDPEVLLTQSRAADAPARKNTRHSNENKHPSGKTAPVKRNTHRKRAKAGYAVLTALLTVAALALLTFGVIAIFDEVANRVLAPDLSDCTAQDASNMVKRSGLIWQQTDVNSDVIPAGYVISQMPEADTAMRQGDSILVTVSLGPAQETMPDYVGTTYETASTKLRDKGFTITVVRIVSTEPIGTVVQQSPKGGSPYTPGQDVELTLSGGSTIVPNVSGMTLEEAQQTLGQSGLVAGDPLYAPVEDSAQIGRIIAQTPAADTQAIVEGKVIVTIGVEDTAAFRGEISFEMAPSEGNRTIRVVLVENQGEMEQHSEVYPAGNSGTVTVPLKSAYGGSMICRIYVDSMLYLEQSVNLVKEEP